MHGRGPETVSLLLYIILYLAVSYVHEPGTGMMTAWNLAENYSFLEILSELPGRCGEPPLYMLLLAPFAKAGATVVLVGFGLFFQDWLPRWCFFCLRFRVRLSFFFHLHILCFTSTVSKAGFFHR